MKKVKTALTGFLLCFSLGFTIAQNVSGKIIDVRSSNPLKGVSVKVENTSIFTETNSDGNFNLEVFNAKNATLKIEFIGYETQLISIDFENNAAVDLGIIFLREMLAETQNEGIVALSDDDLSEDGERSADYVAGIFQSSQDAFLRAAAFNFSQAWFKVRGFDSAKGTILINGIEMNKMLDGRPQWSNWGGLNDVFRNQEFTSGIRINEHTFGSVLGTTSFNTRASSYQPVSKFSASSTNRSYTGRAMATYASGLTKRNWAYTVSASGRMANEGYNEGTSYNSWSAFAAVEKVFSAKNSLNLTAFASSNRRGKSSPNTQEVFDLKGLKYNAYWGNYNGEQRNSRIKEVMEPVVMLSHFYTSEKTQIQTTAAFQFGHIGNSRLGYFNVPNPDPTYWRYLPSNYVQYQDNLDYENAYLAEQEFLKNGQINWFNLYQTNLYNGNALYYLYEDRTDDTQLSITSKINAKIGNNSNFYGGVAFRNVVSNNYAQMRDLLGGNGFTDLDPFATGNAQQNDLNNPNRVVLENEAFQYNYTINAFDIQAFTQFEKSSQKADYFISARVNNAKYSRNGLYKNGTYADNSYGKSETITFTNFSFKGGLTYKITGRHLIEFNAAQVSTPPTIKNSFANARVNNTITPNLKSEVLQTADINYLVRLPKILGRVTAYYAKISDAIETSFYFAQGLLGNQADFVNEIMTGIEKKHFGAELSAEYQATSTIKLLGAGAWGQFTYNNNPQLYLLSETFIDENSDFGQAFLKNYKVSGTPQQAYSLGFEYRDPDFWWFQVNTNYLTNNYLDVSPLLRTANFYTDADGVPFIDSKTGAFVTQEQVANLLQQEKFDDAFLVNVVGGKSWKINDKYIGFFAGINNVLGEVFKTGGFEQARKSNYPEFKRDKELEMPVFGPKYYYGNKATYYLNVYVRF